MLAEINFSYGERVDKNIAEQLRSLLQVDDAKEFYEETDDPKVVAMRSWNRHIADLEKVKKIAPEVNITVGKIFKQHSDFTAMAERFDQLAERMENLPFNQEQDFNQKVNVHVPNLGLMNVSEVEICEDFCTHALQDKLDNGWRILAICPQPDQRRPDYVLGRSKY